MAKRSTSETNSADASRLYLAQLGERVRKLRQQRGATLKRVAQLSGLSDRFIIEVEKGKANPSLTSINRLADALQTSFKDLLPSDNDENTQTSSPSVRQVLALLKNRPDEQVTRILTCLSAYFDGAKGSHISLIGMRGAGKTTVGNLVARSLKAPFYELDALIEKDTGLSLREIFDLEGENYYRAVEERVLERVLKKTPGVIAAGGGLVMNPTQSDSFKAAFFYGLASGLTRDIDRPRSSRKGRTAVERASGRPETAAGNPGSQDVSLRASRFDCEYYQQIGRSYRQDDPRRFSKFGKSQAKENRREKII